MPRAEAWASRGTMTIEIAICSQTHCGNIQRSTKIGKTKKDNLSQNHHCNSQVQHKELKSRIVFLRNPRDQIRINFLRALGPRQVPNCSLQITRVRVRIVKTQT